MKALYYKLLSALLVTALLLSCFALAEDIAPQAIEEEAAAEEAILTDAIDDAIEEEPETELDAAPAFEAQSEEPLVVEEAEAMDLVEEEDADEAEKLMEPAANELAIDAAHFPDAAFRSYISSSFDTDKSGGLSDSERNSVITMELSRMTAFGGSKQDGEAHPFYWADDTYAVSVNARSLKGIEYFPNLNGLHCSGLNLGSLDVSKNTKLEVLICRGCGLTSLNLGSLPKLRELQAYNNQLSALNVSGCPNLQSLQCERNLLAALDVSKCALAAAVVPANFICRGLTLAYGPNDSSGYVSCDLSVAITGGSPVTVVVVNKTKASYSTTVGTNFAIWIDGVSIFPNAWFKTSKPKVVKKNISSRIAPQYGAYLIAKSKGTSKLTVRCGLKYKKYTITVKVAKAAAPATPAVIPENAIVVAKNTKASVPVGTFHQIYLNGKTGKGYKSSKKSVATVDKNGYIAAVGGGKTKITFKVGGKKRVLTLTVVDPTIPTAIYLDKSGTVAAKVGESQTITAAFPAGTSSTVKWTSSNKKIATVANGVVTFKKKGKVTITATAVKGKKKAKVKFVVSK